MIRDHQEWLGYLQPDGLVVSPLALVDAQVILDTRAIETQQRFLPFAQTVTSGNGDEDITAITDFPAFCCDFLAWPQDCLWGLDAEHPLPDDLTVPLPELGETLAPTFALRDNRPKDPTQPWLLLVKVLELGVAMDAETTGHDAMWTASPTRRFERLLRESKVPIGLLTNGTSVRLIYAPRGENTGSLTFPVYAMTEVGGRPILAAFYELLSGYRLYVAPSDARLPALLHRSREYQAAVSTKLAQQVLDALYELLRGFQSADERTHGELLRMPLAESPDDVYHGLLAVLMRLVFLLYAEDRGVMPGGSLYQQNYAVHGLFEQLRGDNEHFPDTMDLRYGAWAQLSALFRAVYSGCAHPLMKMPARRGYLFDPQRFPFLDGRTLEEPRLPLVADGVIFRVLQKLLVLEGERLSYRTLDVQQIGSVYEAIMGFNLRTATGPSIAIKPKKPHGAPVPIDFDELLRQPGAERAKWLKAQTEQDMRADSAPALKTALTVDDALAALERRIARSATPNVVPRGAMLLVPSDERRRSGSHYTPRSLTEPIVRKALEPILKRLGADVTPEQLLDLMICDPAMGSGAFLVEACRQLAEALVQAWHTHKRVPTIPPDEDELLYARRLIAQRCLYGVDKNPMAVDLAKLSLWLATLAKDHPFTFLDHTFRAGDSLVGLTRRQIECFHWIQQPEQGLFEQVISNRVAEATQQRRLILSAGDTLSPERKTEQLAKADLLLLDVRVAGDLVIAAFFGADKDKAREEKRKGLIDSIAAYLALPQHPISDSSDNSDILSVVKDLHSGTFPLMPFHWEIEFPEVFDRENGGFDVMLGNPPFMGGGKVTSANSVHYLDWIKTLHEDSHGNADIVAHFFRRAFYLIRNAGCLGFIATNTIGQGDTRSTGLRWICTHGGAIYWAHRRHKWPEQAAVIVSVVHAFKGNYIGPVELDDRSVSKISAYLFHAGGHENPSVMQSNKDQAFNGVKIYGQGFCFDDTDSSGLSNPLSEMQNLLMHESRNAERIFPYIGGEEVNESPVHAFHRYVINFADWPLRRSDFGTNWLNASDEKRQEWLLSGTVPLDYPDNVAGDWPELLWIVEHKVKSARMQLREDADGGRLRKYWWRYARTRPELYGAISKYDRILVNSQVSHYLGFALIPSTWIFSHALNIFSLATFDAFCILQNNTHEVWARFFASSMKDDLRYTPSDCFETFPFPPNWKQNKILEQAGREYYEFRAALMVRNDEGLTKTYNRFHNPEENSPDILKLRELHAAMDRAVLEAYGWTDISTDCQFLLDYEDEDGDEDTGGRKRKKPWRYRWPDEVRDEVLARLLALNAQRAEEERIAAEAAEKAEMGASSATRKPRKAKKGNAGQVNMEELL